MKLPSEHPHIPKPKVGVLLINLGTPDRTDYFSMRRYLNEFLSDKRVIEVPAFLWQPILKLIILTVRPKKSGKLYDKIWNKKQNESPLRTNTRLQAEQLSKSSQRNVIVEWAMRYGNPSIKDKINILLEKGCTKILFFPLYPQYSATTTASVMDKIYEALKFIRWQPSIRMVPPFYDERIYIETIVESIKSHIKKLNWKPDVLLCSFHGIPKKYFVKGDPYHCHCVKTKRLIEEKLKKNIHNVELSFQSRFGPQEWLKPYMNDKFDELIKKRKKKICVIAPGFVSDCLETLEEISIQGEKDFLEQGGTHFSYIPCLNNQKNSAKMLNILINKELAGWI